ncbi:MAG: carboxypeptidase-like regulatory domain-containing protein [Muribaculaceae bacterium]|nr:carboxypeptidase-like regulatory domain-containing protein [Muribaculaceae bacterium]
MTLTAGRGWRLFVILSFILAVAFTSEGSQVPKEKVTELEEVIVRPKRQKYKKKGNPAYELMQEVRAKAPLYDPSADSAYSYDYYEKIVLGMNDMAVDSTSRRLGFLTAYADTAVNTGKPVVLLSIKERIGSHLETNDPRREKDVIYSKKSEGIDKGLNQDNVNKMLEDILRNIDIYGNDITLMQQRFVSPLGRLAGDYYHYSITDTVTFPEDARKYVELSFAPVNPESFSFNGKLYVADDSTRFIKKVTMRVPQAINLNYIDNIFINQEFKQDALGKRHKATDDLALEVRIIPGTPSFYARKETHAYNFDSEIRDELKFALHDLGNEIEINEYQGPTMDQLWNQMRIVPLKEAELNLTGLHAEMKKKSPLFYWGEKIVVILAKGYVGTSVKGAPSKFDFGPVNTLISYNTLEGVRLRVGGMTTGSLSPHLFGRGYVAYGFRDHKWKYLAEAEYSFRPKKLHAREFPIHSLRATHSYDVDMLGQHYLFTNPDNIFLSLKRSGSDLATYRRLSMLEYTLELKNNFSLVAGFKHQIQFATRFVPFINGNGRSFGNFTQSSFFIRLRYAPGEVFHQGRTMRMPINMDAPVIQLTHEYGPKGFLGSAFTLNVTELSFQKRFWFSSFGFADVILKGGKVWSKVQYPALLWPNANLSFTIQPESYSLMNPMEFANDWYGALDLTYWLNGLIFNRIPYVNKAKLREVVTFKMLMGGLSRKNNPENDPELYRFPSDSDTHIMGRTPYMEIGAGIDNILTILRVDYVWRLSYRDVPGIDRSGLRISLHFSF